jgi:hypothetical protein
VLSAFVAQAQSWEETFAAEPLATYLTGSELRVIVVAAGENSGESAAAATALEQALKASGKTSLVMPDDSLGDVSKLDDARIVLKCQALPVELVAVVRVFAGSEGAPANTVVVFYDKNAEVAVALNGVLGTVLPANPKAGSTGQGAPAEAVDAVSTITEGSARDARAALVQYRRELIWFETIGVVHPGTGAILETWSAPYKGVHGDPLDGPEFYRLVGRDDLAARYKRRKGVRLGLIIGGIAVGVAGLGVMLWGTENVETDKCKERDEDDECLAYEENWTPIYVGLGMALAGCAAGITGPFIRPHPVDAHEAFRLANAYNQRLKERLGLTDEDLEEVEGGRVSNFSLSPLVGPNGGGLGVGANFSLEPR